MNEDVAGAAEWRVGVKGSEGIWCPDLLLLSATPDWPAWGSIE